MKSIYERFGKLFLELGKVRIAKWKKLEPKKKILQTKGHKILAYGIKSNHELTLSSSLVSEISEIKADFSSARKEQTNLLDLAKKEISSKESEITKDLSDIEMRLIKLNNEYILKLEKKALMQEQKINKEKNERIERQAMKTVVEYKYAYAMQCYTNSIRDGFMFSWMKLTKENFEERIIILHKYTPKIENKDIDKYLLENNVSYISKEEAFNILKDNFDYEKFKVEYVTFVNLLKKRYLELVEIKRGQFNGTSSLDELNKLEEAEKELYYIEVSGALEEIIKFTEEKIQDIKVKEETETQHKIQAIERPAGRRTFIAVLSKENVDWNSIIKFYIEKNGTKKLEFITANLVKNGMPEIEGVKYEEKIINVNRKK